MVVNEVNNHIHQQNHNKIIYINKISVKTPSVREKQVLDHRLSQFFAPQIRSKTMALSESAQLGQCHLATWQQEPQGEKGFVKNQSG